MKFIHLSDLHIGKRVNGFSMIDDQRYILDRILDIVDVENPNGIIIAGDIYDKFIPPTEAVQLFNNFIVSLSGRGQKVFAISGNHDSPERIAFGSELMNSAGVYFSPVYNGKVKPISLEDEHGRVNIYMLPFVKPSNVRQCYPDEKIESYTDAVRCAVDHMEIDTSERNILIAHQFVTGASQCDSEAPSVGGIDNVDVSAFAGFDYVALGHIHTPQNTGRETVRYCGSPLKYSFSEAKHIKSVTVLNIGEKGNVSIDTIPLIPKRDMCEIQGLYNDITLRSFYEGNNINKEDYFHITLTDENDIIDAISKLRIFYPNIMKLDYNNKRTSSISQITVADDLGKKTPLELLEEFYELQNNQSMSDEEKKFVLSLIEEISEERV